MKCPFCGFQENRVVDSRPTDEETATRRRRECLSCHKRFTTYEKIETIPLMVVKKDRSRQPFDRDKLLGGIVRACANRPVTIKKMEAIVNDIEATCQNELDYEVTTKQVGEMVMERLKQVDEVAYVRFASVYRQFRDINTFMEELKKLLEEQ